jgi:hypothetical protein
MSIMNYVVVVCVYVCVYICVCVCWVCVCGRCVCVAGVWLAVKHQCSDDDHDDAHSTSIAISANFGVGFLPLLGEPGG